MDRKEFAKLIKNNLLRIVSDEIKYLKAEKDNSAFFVYSPLDKSDKDSEFIDKQIRELYYLYDKHRLQCKDYLGNHAVDLDRHKLATVFLCMTLEYQPIRFYSKYKRVCSEQLALANYRIAFRFACSYAMIALFASFVFKINNKKKEIEDIRKQEVKNGYLNQCQIMELEVEIEKLTNAKECLKERGYPFFPQTRPHLDDYVVNYIKVLYLQFSRTYKHSIIPYALIADTFYWIDVYAKMQLKIDVSPIDYEYGLNRFAPGSNSQEVKEVTVTEDNQTEESNGKKSKGKKKK